MIVEVWFDPGCPFTWLMSRWIAAVEPRRDLDIRWRTFSLLMKNDPPETSPWYAKQARARDLLRVVEAADEGGGTDRIGDLYTEFGRRIHHRGETDFAVEPILEELGLDSGFAAAVDDPEFDSRIEAPGQRSRQVADAQHGADRPRRRGTTEHELASESALCLETPLIGEPLAHGAPDIAAGTEYLASRPEVDTGRIGVLGFSMGGEEAIGAAAADPRIRAVVAEGATARQPADKAWLSDVYGWRGWLQEQVEKVQYGITDYLTEASAPIALRSAVARSPGTRFLLITAGNVDDEAHAPFSIQAAERDRVTVWNVDGADHTGGHDTQPDEWEQRVVEFLDESLK